MIRKNSNFSIKDVYTTEEDQNFPEENLEDSYERLVQLEKQGDFSKEVNGENYYETNEFIDINQVLDTTDRSYANKGEEKLQFYELIDPSHINYLPIINAENYRNPKNCYCDICKDNRNYLWNYMPNAQAFMNNSKPGETNDDIVLCKLCYSACHQSCYGSELLLEKKADWLCHRCKFIKSLNLSFDTVKCFLCPSNELGGMMKRIDTDKWAHIECINWNPNLAFKDIKKEGLLQPYNIKHKTTLTCSLCCLREGTCIQCDYKDCTIAFHVRCAKRRGLIQHWAIMQRFQNELG
jgi:hypothetical protein